MTPACAGTTLRRPDADPQAGDDPRVCGDDATAAALTEPALG